MDELARLQKWYQSQCNDEWEHRYGVRLDSLDNPGWWLKIDLVGTPLEGRAFSKVERGNGESKGDWISCSIQDGQFHGAGGSFNLGEILRIFLDWAEGEA